jgi:hypothetical protein
MRECICNAPIPIVGHVQHARGCESDRIRGGAFGPDDDWDAMNRRAGPPPPVRSLSLAERAELLRMAEAIERGWAAAGAKRRAAAA